MISNDDKIGNYFVRVFADVNSVAEFQCPTLEDAQLEARHIAKKRRASGLKTGSASAWLITGYTTKRRRRRIELGPVININIE